ncbi:MAG: hypothetical protein J7L07_07480 [Candidatus Odinarchaeota archaeon]|nr:hypothetical protein [Candidatus Odinarchaeota archaeon]
MKLAEKQERVWELSNQGLSVSEIAKKLGISRQAVSIYFRQAKTKMTEILLDLAESIDAEILKLDVAKGVLIGRIRQINEKVYLIYVPRVGPCTIYESTVKTCICPDGSVCKKVIRYFLNKIKDRNLQDKEILQYIISNFVEKLL